MKIFLVIALMFASNVSMACSDADMEKIANDMIGKMKNSFKIQEVYLSKPHIRQEITELFMFVKTEPIKDQRKPQVIVVQGKIKNGKCVAEKPFFTTEMSKLSF